MKSLANLLSQPVGQPIIADDVLELHAARLLLLILNCGTKTKATGLSRVDGLTKLAKLDFLVRYPEFFEKLSAHLGHPIAAPAHEVESSMVRFHYGPWDERYYHILAYLESRNLLAVEKDGSTFRFALTSDGTKVADDLAKLDSFSALTEHMRNVKKLIGNMGGTKLKDTIYDVFGEEVVNRKLGESIS
jgi:hypothetical protein